MNNFHDCGEITVNRLVAILIAGAQRVIRRTQ